MEHCEIFSPYHVSVTVVTGDLSTGRPALTVSLGMAQSLHTSHGKARCRGCAKGGALGVCGWVRLQGLGASQESGLMGGEAGQWAC